MVEIEHLKGEKSFLVNGVDNIGNLNIVSNNLHFKVLRTDNEKNFRVNYFPNFDDHDVDVTYQGEHVAGSPFSLVPRMPTFEHFPDQNRFVLDNVGKYDLLDINCNALEYRVYKENNEKYSFNYDPITNGNSETVEIRYNNKPVENGVFQLGPPSSEIKKEPHQLKTGVAADPKIKDDVKEASDLKVEDDETIKENSSEENADTTSFKHSDGNTTAESVESDKHISGKADNAHVKHGDNIPVKELKSSEHSSESTSGEHVDSDTHQDQNKVSEVTGNGPENTEDKPGSEKSRLVFSGNMEKATHHFLMAGQPQQSTFQPNTNTTPMQENNVGLGKMVMVGNMYQASNGQWLSHYA